MIGTSLLFSGSIGGLISPFDTIAPTAGYSLRALTLSYTGAVVRVRRDGDGAEQDFTSTQITNGDLEAFLNVPAQSEHTVDVYLDLKRGIVPLTKPTQFYNFEDVSLVSDCFTGGSGTMESYDSLFSMVDHNTKVYYDLDFSSLKTDASLVSPLNSGSSGVLEAFTTRNELIGQSNGFVHTWYDQSGNGYHAVQVTDADQPKIWDSVTGLVTENGKPAIDFDGVDDQFSISVAITPEFSLLGVYKNTKAESYLLGSSVSQFGRSSTNQYRFHVTGSFSANAGIHSDTQVLLTGIEDDTNATIYANSAQIVQVSSTFVSDTLDTISRLSFDGTGQEIIIYNSDQSANRTAIESNINGYYNIFDDSVIYFQGVEYRVVYNPATGRYWLDRNLGASQVATSISDSNAYGDLYQWGRYAEGHQLRSSSTTTTLATTEVPNDGNTWDGDFITTSASPDDWLTTPDNNLWQGVSGVNIPAPEGFRLPTEAEWEAERASWSTNNRAGAFASPLKLPSAGLRRYDDGSFGSAGSIGYYWSSTVDGSDAKSLLFFSSNAFMFSYVRAYGFSVRLIKDES